MFVIFRLWYWNKWFMKIFVYSRIFRNSWIKKLHHFWFIKKSFTTSNELMFVYMLCKKIASKTLFVNQFSIDSESFIFHCFSFTCSNRVVFESILYLIYSKTMIKRSAQNKNELIKFTKSKKRKIMFTNSNFDDEMKLKRLSRNRSFLIEDFDEKIYINRTRNRRIVIEINAVDWTNEFIDCFAETKFIVRFQHKKQRRKFRRRRSKFILKKIFNNCEKNSTFDVIRNKIKNRIINSTKLKKKMMFNIFFFRTEREFHRHNKNRNLLNDSYLWLTSCRQSKILTIKTKKNVMKIMKSYLLSYIISEAIDAKFSLWSKKKKQWLNETMLTIWI